VLPLSKPVRYAELDYFRHERYHFHPYPPYVTTCIDGNGSGVHGVGTAELSEDSEARSGTAAFPRLCGRTQRLKDMPLSN